MLVFQLFKSKVPPNCSSCSTVELWRFQLFPDPTVGELVRHPTVKIVLSYWLSVIMSIFVLSMPTADLQSEFVPVDGTWRPDWTVKVARDAISHTFFFAESLFCRVFASPTLGVGVTPCHS